MSASNGSAQHSGLDYFKLARLIQPYWNFLSCGCLFLALESMAGLVALQQAGAIVDSAQSGDIFKLHHTVLLLLALFAGIGLLIYFEHRLLETAGARLVYDFRNKLFAHLVHLSPEFYEARRIGELLSRLTADIAIFQRALTNHLPGGVQALMSLVGSLVVMLSLHVQLALTTLAIIPAVILLSLWFGNRLGRLTAQVQDAVADTSATVEEALTGIRTVQAFGREQHEIYCFQMRLRQVLGLQFENIRLAAAFSGMVQFLGFGAFGAVLWYGAWLVARRELTAGELTSFLLCSSLIAGSVGSLGRLYGSYRELQGASSRVFELLAISPSIADPPNSIPRSRPQGDFVFDGVSFRYPNSVGRWALQGIDLRVSPGEMVAVVGPSGAGKSTLFSLMVRFFDPTIGSIRLDGHDLRTLRLSELRGAIGLVPQETFLFSGTIEENLRIGNPAATAVQVQNAAIAAGADHFIRDLSEGYESVVGERGIRLSAGQRQRLAIARALLKEPVVLLMDEATSALDAESEEMIQRTMTALRGNRAILVIAHRLATVRQADRILVLDEGRVVGQGTHESLFEANAFYHRCWDLQTQRTPPV